ncbi:hypothetical protein YWY31_34870 [Paenibacillus illinoisensis]
MDLDRIYANPKDFLLEKRLVQLNCAIFELRSISNSILLLGGGEIELEDKKTRELHHDMVVKHRSF